LASSDRDLNRMRVSLDWIGGAGAPAVIRLRLVCRIRRGSSDLSDLHENCGTATHTSKLKQTTLLAPYFVTRK